VESHPENEKNADPEPTITAIWDNRSVFHCATFDYEGLGERFGNRVVGIGEKPFFDPSSKSKAEALAAEG
jgi:alpha-ketoglutarate-dependent taurine dioxygenase